MSLSLVALALLMFAVTYPTRAAPLLLPVLDRLPPRVLEYLRLVGPAVLAALAAANTVIVVDAARRASIHVGIEWLSVIVCIALVAWRRNLLLGVAAAVVVAALARATGLG
jgi:branched-subunit amino acid transport protein